MLPASQRHLRHRGIQTHTLTSLSYSLTSPLSHTPPLPSLLQVDYIDIETRTRIAVPGHAKDRTYVFGVIWSFAYKLEGSDEEIIVATTRPETMLGDTAVAVHPDDPRYKQFHGKYLIHPFVDRKIPLITDNVRQQQHQRHSSSSSAIAHTHTTPSPPSLLHTTTTGPRRYVFWYGCGQSDARARP